MTLGGMQIAANARVIALRGCGISRTRSSRTAPDKVKAR
jgi:hypothetical protein